MRFQNIQALRFFAALGVVVFHAAIYVRNDRGGHLVLFFDRYLDYGVFLFFAISGFVIIKPAVDQSARAFLLARFLRIFPPFWVLAVVASIGKLAIFGVQRFDPDLIKALTLMPFGTIPYPVGVEWSLVYEVFFYLAIAFLAAVGGERRMTSLLLGWGILICSVNTIMPAVTEPLPTPLQIVVSAYDLPFICGALARIAYSRGFRLGVPVSVGGAVALLICAELFSAMMPRLLIQGLAFTVVVLAFASSQRQLTRRALLVRGGDWSYGIYLMHVPVIQFMVRSRHFSNIPADTLFILCTLVALMAGVALGAVEFGAHSRVSGLLRARSARYRAQIESRVRES